MSSGPSDGGGGKRRKTGGAEANRPEPVVTDGQLLEHALIAEASLLAQLSGVRKTIEDARQKVRAEGDVEKDSLLIVGEDPLSSVVLFLDPRSLGRCEMTCKILKRLAAKAWTALGRNASFKGSEIDADARTKVIRYHLASSFARRVEPMISRHCRSSPYDTNIGCEGCTSLPTQLCTDLFRHPMDYEVFVRFSKKTDEKEPTLLLSQGFVPFALDSDDDTVVIDMCDCDLSKWPAMGELLSVEGGREYPQWWDIASDAMGSLMVSIVAVRRSGPAASLAYAMCGFDRVDDPQDGWAVFYTEAAMNVETHAHKYHTMREGGYQNDAEFVWDEPRPEKCSRFRLELMTTAPVRHN